MNNNPRKINNENIYDKYRRILGRPELADKEIDEMRYNMKLLT